MEKESAESLIENLVNAAIDVGRTIHLPNSDREKQAAVDRLNYNERKVSRKLTE